MIFRSIFDRLNFFLAARHATAKVDISKLCCIALDE